MSNMKNLADILKVCSILPIFAVMPAMAGVEDYIWNPNFDSYTLEADEKLPNPDSVENAQFNGMRSPTGKFELDGSNFTLDANGWAGLSVGADEEFNMHDFKMVKNFEKASSGGAFLSIAGGVLTIDNVHFMNNSSVGGGAIASGAASAQDGGQAADVTISNSKFTANSATSSGGAISNNASLLKLSNVDFVGNTSGRDGGAVDNNNGGILEISNGAVFKNNIATQNGGAIFAGDVSVIGDILFEENQALNAGAVHVGDKSFVVKKDAQGNDNTVTFKKNVATGNAGAFFVGANGTVDITATNINFVENSGASNGGTIYVQDGTLKLLGENNTFFNNQSTKSEKTYKRGGGVIHNQINSAGSTIVIGGSKNSINSFTSNKAVVNGGAILSRGDGNGYESNMTLNGTTVFEENDAGMNGGALYQYVNAKDTMNVVFNGNVDFDDNNAGENGGAIYNYSSVDGIASIKFNGEVEFENNIAGQNGGAIYNYGTMVLGEAGSTFKDNVASISGGAIYNLGDLTIKNGDFENNKITSGNGDGGALYSNTGTLKLVNTNFIDNSAEENPIGGYGYGGAIYAQGGIIDIQGGKYSGNKALFGGAIYVSKSATSANFQDVTFDGNQATGIGALGVFGKNTTLTNLTFTNNSTTGSYETAGGGAALLVGALGQVEINNSTFIGNKSASTGGAIATRYVLNAGGTKNGMKDAMLDIVGGTFTGNIANTKGGAIYNTIYNSKNALGFAYVDDSTFTSNEALEGGAIYNVGIIDAHEGQAKMTLNDVTFTGNKAAAFGGAIYNEDGGTIVLTGENTFVNNTAKGGANDIHNLGTLEIASGTTTIGGGISGTGSLAIAKGTVLNIGTSTIVQDKIEIDGTVTASVLSERSFGRLLGDVEAGSDAKLELTVGSVGTYDIFDDDVDIDIAAGSAFVVTNNGADGVVIETKAVEDLAADTGLTTNAAAVVAALANADSRAMQQVSLAAQVALNAGDNATVEAEAAKVVPDNKPVAQSVAMSVQNQVVNMAANRMAVVTPMGRSGGDTPVAAGAWVQGMFNKTKMNDQFHGYSRGFALGGDTVVADVFTIGGGYAYGTTDVHADNRDTDIESSTVFMYAQYKPTNWYLNATLSYTMSEYEEHATVFGMPMVNTYDVDSYGAQMMTGYTFASGITPEMGVRYLYVESDDYNNGLGDITVDDTQYLAGVMGLKYAFEIESDWALKLRPELRAAATYDFLSDEAIATVTMPGAPAYVVNGDRLSRMGGEFGIGLTAEYKGLNVSLTYDLDLHKDYTSQTGMLKFRYNF